MRCVDVNVLVYAHRPESPDHEAYRAWLDEARRGPQLLGVPSLVLSGFLRIVTHPRIFREPTPLETAFAFVDALRTSPAVRVLEPGPQHWRLFADLSHRLGARGNVIPDAYLAAIAIEQGASWVSADRGFGGFPALRWEHPLET